MEFLIISGVSGAGKSHVVKCFEDMGYFCVDNLPPALIPKIAEICFQSRGKIEKIGLVVDIRGKDFLNELDSGLLYLKEAGFKYEILFLEASDDVLIKRFKESRRTHPLSSGGRLIKAILSERKILQDIRNKAKHIIDTSNLTIGQLKKELLDIFIKGEKFKGIMINIISFGFKYGIPIDCDLVFDVRFLPNPFYIAELKKHTGKHEKVKNFVFQKEETKEFMKRIEDLIFYLLPYYVKEGKSRLVIGVGCTGGRHRSVVIANSLCEKISQKEYRAVCEHRDIDKDIKNI